MKTKTSITLSEDVLTVVDRRSTGKSRSEFIETALWAYIAQLAHNERDARDLDILNRNADRLNQEAADVLTYQVIS
jgi:metal-responsive CopG/Arc/MetJ family transcriptional regulator